MTCLNMIQPCLLLPPSQRQNQDVSLALQLARKLPPVMVITPCKRIAFCSDQELHKFQINDRCGCMHQPALHYVSSFISLHALSFYMSLWFLIPPCLTTTSKGHNIERALEILLEILDASWTINLKSLPSACCAMIPTDRF